MTDAALRSVVEGADVELPEITFKTVRAIRRLGAAPSQAGFVAPNAMSIAAAHFAPTALFRAIYAGGQPVGFLMLELDTDQPGATALLTSWMPADGGPKSFYRGLGFVPTGEVDDGEVVGRLAL